VSEAVCLDDSYLLLFVSQAMRKLSSPLLAINTCVLWITGIPSGYDLVGMVVSGGWDLMILEVFSNL